MDNDSYCIVCEKPSQECECPEDFEICGDCGFDHEYEYPQAVKWHTENPGSYD